MSRFGPGYGSTDAGGYGNTGAYGSTEGQVIKSHTGQVISDGSGGGIGATPYGQTLAPMAATDTGMRNAAQPGPGVMPSVQWQANMQAHAPGAQLPGVMYQVPHQPGPASQFQTYGMIPYGATPVGVYTWAGSGGWHYTLLSDDSILATGQHSGMQYTNKPLAVGTSQHLAVVEEWMRSHPGELSKPIGAKFSALMHAGSPGLLSSVASAIRDAASTVSGGAIAPSTTIPTNVASTPVQQVVVQTPQGPAVMQVPVPPQRNRGVMIAGGVFVALGLAAGAYYFLAPGVKKVTKVNPDGTIVEVEE